MIVFALVPLLGGLSMGGEVANWFLMKRNMQNAADTAALAAGANTTTTFCTVTADDCYEAKAVAARYGFTDGANNVTVTVAPLQTCPTVNVVLTDCYKVTISKKVPIYLASIVGYSGNTTIGTRPAVTVTASAMASGPGLQTGFCSIALGLGKSFTINGGPNVDFKGCNLRSSGDLTCNGANSDTGVSYGYAAGNSKCGVTQVSNYTIPTPADPYTSLDANPPIPNNPCGGVYPQSSGAAITGTHVITSATGFGSAVTICGNARLGAASGNQSGNVINITTANTVIAIYNGSLDLYGNTLQTSGAGTVTIIFSGTTPSGTTGGSTTYSHIPINSTGSGTIDIAAPLSGSLQGVAMMQDSRINGNRDANDISYSGNNPTLLIQGLLYIPNSNFSISGAINMHTAGLSCIGIVAKTITVSGQGSIFKNDAVGTTAQCPQAGLTLPGVPGTNQRQALFQ